MISDGNADVRIGPDARRRRSNGSARKFGRWPSCRWTRRNPPAHVRELESAGFAVTTGTSGQPTAFIAEWEQGNWWTEGRFSARIRCAARTRQRRCAASSTRAHPERPAVTGAGITCWEGCTGAAIALKTRRGTRRHTRSLAVCGCAAEETTGAKVFMARDGLFDDLFEQEQV